MTFRDRLTIALLAIAAIPLAILGFGVRRELTSRLDAEAMRRVRAVEASTTARVAERIALDQARLESLAASLAADSRFRLAVTGADRRWLLDWAAAAMRSAGFAMLLVQDAEGRILSSGHFRNDYDRVAPAVPRGIEESPSLAAVVDARTPTGTVRALATMATFTVRGQRYTVSGGAALDSATVATLSTDRDVAARLHLGDARPPAPLVTAAAFPLVDEAAEGAVAWASVVLVPDTAPAQALRAGVSRWLLLSLASALLVAVVVAAVLGRVVAAPIGDLASRTSRLDLDRLDQRFSSGRADELGVLERTLDALVGRLRSSLVRLRKAERAAAVGDVARQVNHDIRNGLTPIRNVVRHLSQTVEREPAALAALYSERRATLEAGIEYLDDLARTYARLSPALRGGPTDPRPVVIAVARGVTDVPVTVDLPDSLPAVRADAVVLRRILENLVSNAVDALEGRVGTLAIGAEVRGDGVGRRVRFTVADTGRGMTRDELNHAFNDFYTTKPTGTGLGLTVVRRLLTDIGGSVYAETSPGRGSLFAVEIPVADVPKVLPPMVYAQ